MLATRPLPEFSAPELRAAIARRWGLRGSVTALAEATRLDKNRLSLILNGRLRPGEKTLRRILAVLDPDDAERVCPALAKRDDSGEA